MIPARRSRIQPVPGSIIASIAAPGQGNRNVAALHGDRQPLRLWFAAGNGYLAIVRDGEKTLYHATDRVQEYFTLFSTLYKTLFDENPGFKL